MEKRNVNELKSDEMSELEKKGIELVFNACVEGAVLLENNGILPLAARRIALFGLGSRMTMVRGIGSGDVAYRYVVNIENGLENVGFSITSTPWLDRLDERYKGYRKNLLDDVAEESKKTGIDNLHVMYSYPHIIPVYEDILQSDLEMADTDTVIYVLTRKEGEGRDNRYVRGEYLPAEEELQHLKILRENFKNLILLLNIGSPIDMKEILEISPDAVLLIFQGGAEIGNATAQLITGAHTPSGKLTSTWAKDYWDYPNSKEFGENDGDVTNELYREGIYIGYRYFDTFAVTPQYPFGHGKSYTVFSLQTTSLICEKNRIDITVLVTNTGAYSGKEVIQLYVTLPSTEIDRPEKQLCAFAKTKCLLPSEKELVRLSFNMEDISSYSEERSAYLLEAGEYVLHVGTSSRDINVCGIISLDELCIIKQVRHLYDRPTLFEVMTPPLVPCSKRERKHEANIFTCRMNVKDMPPAVNAQYSKDHENFFGGKIDPNTVNHGEGGDRFLQVPDNISLAQVESGDYSIEQMVASMDEDELINLVTGQEHIDTRYQIDSVSTHVPGAAGETTNYFLNERPQREIPYTVLADGPAGLRLIRHVQEDPNGGLTFVNPLLAYEGGEFVEDSGYVDGYADCYQNATALPISTQLASTWNTDILYKMGELVGAEMERYDVDLWLAPGMNLHRNPLCGRNFEYFSEDPFVSAATAIALVRGVQSRKGRGATIKHMAASNQEAARTSHNSVVDERTMRDLYLKGFELTVKYAEPYAIMTSLNRVNGSHGTNNKDIATYTVRDEWGFQGVIMTDWNTTTPARGANTSACINSGNNLIMPGSSSDHVKLKEALHNLSGHGDTISLGNLQYCAMNVLRYILRTNRLDKTGGAQ